MTSFKNSFSLKIISVLLITTFTNLDFAWAYPETSLSNRNLAVWSNFQQPVNPAHFDALSSMLAKKDLIGGLALISGFVFGNEIEGKGSFGRLAGVIPK
jgi:hypothetical protein